MCMFQAKYQSLPIHPQLTSIFSNDSQDYGVCFIGYAHVVAILNLCSGEKLALLKS